MASAWFARRALRRCAVLLAGVAMAATPSCERVPTQLREFRGAYAEQAQPTGVIREFALDAAPATVPLFDGRLMQVWAYNGQVPGPTMRVRLGDTVRVTFTNHLPQPTTIHWHGLRIPNAMDGVPGVTQPPVQPGEAFVYEFTPKDAGTFWFHPHLRASEQVERGLFGVLIVEDAHPLPYSRDVVWVLDDWLLDRNDTIHPQFNTRHDLAHDGRWGNLITVNGFLRPQLSVRAGERIRLRLLNVANGRVFAPDFGQLAATVIAVDGMYTARPLALRGFELAPGNRLDLDIVVDPAQRGERTTVVDRFTRQPIPLAEIAVGEDAVETPRFASPATAHVPAWTDLAGAPPRTELRLNARAGGPFGIQWTINDEAFDHDHDPSGHALHRLPYRQWSKVRFTNESFRLHPMHIHGMFFKVLARNGTPVDEPYWRDTVLLRAKETVDVGVVPLDKGLWMAHCHILEHAEAGMMTLVDVQ